MFRIYHSISSVFDKGDLNHGVYLWIIHCDKIPPHIGISCNGKYFSLKANGVDFDLNYDRVIHILNKKNISTLLFKINVESISLTDLIEVFSKYTTTEYNSVTCLNPINDLLGKKCSTVHELLTELSETNFISVCIGLNLKTGYKGIPIYTSKEIHERLLALENASQR